MPFVKGQKFRLGKKRPPFSVEWRRKLSETHNWKKMTEEQKEQWRENRRGKNNPNYKGGRVKIGSGYMGIYQPNHPYANNKGYILEHRLVMEKYLGRYLTPREVVHHLGGKIDNRPHMLICFIHGNAHRRFHQGRFLKNEEIIFDGRNIIPK